MKRITRFWTWRVPAVVLGLVLIVLATGAPRPAQAQVLIGMLLGDKVTTDDFHIGLNVGPNLATFDGLDGAETRLGLCLGLTGEWRFARNFYLQPEILPFFRAGSKGLPTDLVGPDPFDPGVVGGGESESAPALVLSGTGRDDSLAHRGAALPGGGVHQLLVGEGGDLDLDVEAVQHGPRDPRTVAGPVGGAAAARSATVPVVATAARVHGAHQQEPGRELHRAALADHREPTLLERLSQKIEGVGAELGKLVEEQHAVV